MNRLNLRQIEFIKLLLNETEYKAIKNFANILKASIYYLYQYFTSFGLIREKNESKDKVLNKLDSTAVTFRDNLTKYIQEILQVNIKKDKDIMDKLLLHIRAMLNRMQYDIQISNPLINGIKTEYPILLNVSKIASMIVSRELKQKMISMDEIGYLTLYYQLALENYSIKKRVLVICHSGYGTSKLLSVKLRSYFPEFEIVEGISASKVINMNLDNIDFVISTVPLDLQSKPYLLVSTFLTEYDVKNISDFMIKNKGTKLTEVATTSFISRYLNEELIYFNKDKKEVIKDINKNLKLKLTFDEMKLSENLKVCIAFSNKKDVLGVSINNSKNNEKEVIFYIIIKNSKITSNLLKEVVNFDINKNYAIYLRNCIKKEDVKRYFTLNSKGGHEMGVDLKKVIKKETIKLDMKATTKDEALEELTDLLYDAGTILDKEKFLKDVYYRETLGSTGIGNEIAIPHGKSEFVSKTSIAFGKTSTDIEWETLDDKPVRFIILFAVTESDKESVHVRLLSKVARKLGNEEICDELLKAKTPEKVYEIITSPKGLLNKIQKDLGL